MPKHTSPPLLIGMTLLLTLVLVGAYWMHMRHLRAALLATDPDTIPAKPGLMLFALARGDSAYRTYCIGCHGENGRGDPSRGIPVLSDADWLYGNGLVSDIERIVTYGIRSNHPKAWNLAVMPGFARARPSATNPGIVPLSPTEIGDVVEFLVQEQRQPADTVAAARGAQVYQGVGGCYDCHSPDAKGDNAIGAPNLTDNVALYGNNGRDSLRDSIANGRQGICPAWSRVLSAASIREVAVYVYHLAHPATENRGPLR